MARDDIGDEIGDIEDRFGHGHENERQEELETPLLQSVQASTTTRLLSSKARAWLDKLCHQSTPQRVETQESMDALANLENLVGLSFTDVINKDLYGSFKTAVNVLISANYFDPQHVKIMEDHIATTDAYAIIQKHALKRWDEGREHERYKNVVALLAKLEQSFNKDALELEKLEGRIQLIRKRMEVTIDTIHGELKDHKVELGIYSAHNQGIQDFSVIKDDLDKALKDGEREWNA